MPDYGSPTAEPLVPARAPQVTDRRYDYTGAALAAALGLAGRVAAVGYDTETQIFQVWTREERP